MSETGLVGEAVREVQGEVDERRIRFVDEVKDGDVVLMSFRDPGLRYAVLVEGSGKGEAGDGRGDVLEVLLLPSAVAVQGIPGRSAADWMEASAAGAAPAVFVKYRGVELMWRAGRAVLQCEAEQAEALLSGVVEFAYYERELRRIEEEIADTWEELEEDRALAFEVKAADLKRSAVVGGRMDRVLERRMRHVRIEPHLYAPDAKLAAAGQKLGEELREKARIEARVEAVSSQLEVFEDVYEMGGQRMGEYRAAHEEHTLEWIIIVLLAVETLLMLVAAAWRVKL